MSLISTDIDRAVELLRAGGLVAVPTETVYGLAADASNPSAVERIFQVKGRPLGHPLIVHVAEVDDLDVWADSPAPLARQLAALAWPGPLTLIVPRSIKVADAVTGGRPTVGVRVPSHPIMRSLLRRSGLGLAAPSANRFGAVSPTTARHVADDIGDLLDPDRDLILDGGPADIGLESTIVDTTTDPPQLLRAGPVTGAQIDGLATASGPSRASGMLASHYAPTCEVHLVDDLDEARTVSAHTPGARILDLNDDLVEYARRLYSELRSADSDGISTLVAVLPPPDGLGLAIRDRLAKAAAPRP